MFVGMLMKKFVVDVDPKLIQQISGGIVKQGIYGTVDGESNAAIAAGIIGV